MGTANSTKKKVLIFTFKEGHLSIAHAIKQYLDKDYNCEIYDAITKNEKIGNLTLDKLYMPFYQFFPSLFKIPFELSQKDKIISSLRKKFLKDFKPTLEEKINSFQPDLIISTYYSYNPALAEITKEIPFINIVTDPRTFSLLIPEPKADINFVYDQTAAVRCKQAGCSDENVEISGWFVRKPFYNHTTQNQQLLDKLGFKKDHLTFLICGGSEGANAILKILPTIINSSKKVQTAVICGSNKNLYKALNSTKKITTEVFNNYYDPDNVKIFSHVDNMAEFISIADLVIGKAGPNLLFESVATHTPFFAITHISGQEDGNLDIIKEKDLGEVEENPFKAAKKINKIIKNPNQLDQFKKPLKKERSYNQQAEEIILKKIEALFDN
jgi:processive 1,2-diacylglycerol beta-glucosyltransferase